LELALRFYFQIYLYPIRTLRHFYYDENDNHEYDNDIIEFHCFIHLIRVSKIGVKVCIIDFNHKKIIHKYFRYSKNNLL